MQAPGCGEVAAQPCLASLGIQCCQGPYPGTASAQQQQFRAAAVFRSVSASLCGTGTWLHSAQLATMSSPGQCLVLNKDIARK